MSTEPIDLDAIPATVEWATEIRHLNGTVRYKNWGDDKSLARDDADAINEYVASLNEPTRRERGYESARPVLREVRRFPDGSRLIGPWKPVESAAEVS